MGTWKRRQSAYRIYAEGTVESTLARLKAGVQRRRRTWQRSRLPEDRELIKLQRNAYKRAITIRELKEKHL